MKKKFFSAALAAAMVVTSVFSTTSVAGAAENETAVPYGKVTVEQKDNTVTIGNDAIKRTFSTADKKLVEKEQPSLRKKEVKNSLLRQRKSKKDRLP